MRALAAVVAAAAACGHPAPPPAAPAPAPANVAAPAPPDAAPPAPPTPPAPSDDEKLAAIQKAMIDLDGVAHQCWAAAAAERFDIEGSLEARIDIPAAGAAEITVVTDTTHTPKLSACMTKVLAAYPWAPPLHGQMIQLPFKFRAPDGQSVVDRALVPAAAQAGVSVSVLLDEANTGNEAASMFELGIAAKAGTGLRAASRPELWYFLAPASVNGTAVAAGDLMFVPRGAARDVRADTGDVHAMIVMAPGQIEGAARAGALPTQAVSAGKQPGPIFLPGGKPADAAATRAAALTGSVIAVPAGALVPAPPRGVHAYYYVLAGAGTLTLDGTALPVGPTSVIQIPATGKSTFTVTSALRAVQVHVPQAAPAHPEKR